MEKTLIIVIKSKSGLGASSSSIVKVQFITATTAEANN